MRVAILTVSDSAVAGTREDASGPALAEACGQRGWDVALRAIVPDEEAAIIERLTEWADQERVPVILTTGGTGVAARDVTPEATRAVLHREVPGMAELMRARGLEQTKFSVLSRGVAGTRNASLIVNLPGSPRGAVHSLAAVAELIPHIAELLQGKTEHACH